MKSDNGTCTRKLTTQFVDKSGSNASLPAPPRSTNAVNYNMTLCMWKKHQRHQTTVPSTDAVVESSYDDVMQLCGVEFRGLRVD